MNKKASDDSLEKSAIAAGKSLAEIRAADLPVNILPAQKFQVNDLVRVIAEGPQQYKILNRRDHEPCCQIQRNDVLKRLEWMISEELELVSKPADADIPDASATDPGARVS